MLLQWSTIERSPATIWSSWRVRRTCWAETTTTSPRLSRRTRPISLRGGRSRGSLCFFIGLNLMPRGEHSRGAGWFARAERLLDRGRLDCAERGYRMHLRIKGVSRSADLHSHQ